MRLVAHGDIARRHAKVCVLPLPHYGWDRAPRPPPLQHRVPIRAAAYATGISWSGLLRGLYSHRQSGFRVWPLGPFFWSSRRPGHRMSLSTLVYTRRRSSAADSVCCNPWHIQAVPEPPGRLPPAPGSHIRRAVPSPGNSFVDSGGLTFSSARADSHAVAFFLADSWTLMWALLLCFRLANALATWRQA